MGRGAAAWATSPTVLRVGISKNPNLNASVYLFITDSAAADNKTSVSFTHDGRVRHVYLWLISSQIAYAY